MRRCNSRGLAIFPHGAVRNDCAVSLEAEDQLVVGQNRIAGLSLDEVADALADPLRGQAAPTVHSAMAAVKKYLSSSVPRGVAMYLLR